MKKTTKALTLALCALLLVAGSVLGTIAYLTSQDEVVNTFAVGKLAIELDEAKTDEAGNGTLVSGAARVKANNYKLVPGHHYIKDPTVHLAADSEACYVFVRVDNQLEGAIFSGSKTGTTMLGITEQITDINAWKPLTISENGASKTIFYKAVDAATAATGTELPVFGYFDVEGAKTQTQLEDFANKTITVTAYACQQDGFEDAAEAWAACFAK